MKRLFFLLSVLLILSHLNAQTCGNGFVLQLILPDGSRPVFGNEDGGYGCAYFSTSVVQEMQGEVVWGRTAAGDSLGCGTIVTDLTNKFALVRLGGCEYSQKSHNSYLAGASAIIIVNHYNFANHDDNTIINLGIVDGGQMPQIPCILVCRKVGNLIADAIDNGLPVTAKFIFSALSKPNVAYHYATPKNQLDTLKHISVHFFNPTADTLHDALVKAEIAEPDGNIVNLSVPVATLAPRQDTLLFFPPYLPPPTVGDFDVVFSNTLFAETIDTVRRRFEVTNNFWAMDNGQIAPGEEVFWGAGEQSYLLYQTGALYRTGPNGGIASHVQFGLANADTLISTNNNTNYQIGVALYDADADDNGENDLQENWDDLELIATGFYQLKGNEPIDSLLTAPLASVHPGSDSVFLKSKHLYYACLVSAYPYTYPMPRYTLTEKEFYPNFLWEPVQFDDDLQLCWIQANYTIVQRLYTNGQPAAPAIHNQLDPSKFTLFPNPANEAVQLDLRLEAVNKKVAVSLLDWQGRVVATELRADFQEGTITFSVQNLPSGAYLLWVRTEEGFAMRKLMICH